jgi:hypothetical protein
MRAQRRGESILETIGGLVVLAVVVGGIIWYTTGKSPLEWLTSGPNPIIPSIVGRWRLDANSSNTIEFFSDGTLRETALLKTSNGTYVLLSGGRLKTETDGLLWGTNVATWTYTLTSTKLTMTTEGGVGITLNWTRID